MSHEDPASTSPLDKLAADLAALTYIVRAQADELARFRAQALQVVPPCRGCGEAVLGFRPPACPIERAELQSCGIDPESGHRVLCGAAATAIAREALRAVR